MLLCQFTTKLFLRGKPHLHQYMRRLQKPHKKLPTNNEDEPDFYCTDKYGPLPLIEDAPMPLLTNKSGNNSISREDVDTNVVADKVDVGTVG